MRAFSKNSSSIYAAYSKFFKTVEANVELTRYFLGSLLLQTLCAKQYLRHNCQLTTTTQRQKTPTTPSKF
jgi:hypothetical protein